MSEREQRRTPAATRDTTGPTDSRTHQTGRSMQRGEIFAVVCIAAAGVNIAADTDTDVAAAAAGTADVEEATVQGEHDHTCETHFHSCSQYQSIDCPYLCMYVH